MEINKSIIDKLENHKNILSNSSEYQFGNDLKYFLSFLRKEIRILAIIEDLNISYKYSNEDLSRKEEHILANRWMPTFNDFSDQVSFSISFLNFKLIESKKQIERETVFRLQNRDGEKAIVENYIAPIVEYLTDKLESSNSVIYLLEKYKKRTEWFTKDNLYQKYKDATKNYEGILEDDLRLFLFDQGIEYPFSSPKIGKNDRTDVVGNMETNDPLIVEVKIYDSSKNYKKNRIKEGFEQALSYANTYNKNIAYLTVFNVDDIDIVFDTEEFGTTFPSSITQGNITVYFVVIDIYPKNSSSTRKNPKKEIIKKSDLI